MATLRKQDLASRVAARLGGSMTQGSDALNAVLESIKEALVRGDRVVVTGWATNVYMVKLSPHFGQRETIEEYYKRRAGPEEPLVAYQLNWKGENFYTGNKVPAFVSSGKRFTDWVESQRKKGVAVMFFTTEHSRVKSLERELGKVQGFELLTSPALNDKFVLARAVL